MIWIALGQAPGLFLYVYLGTLFELGVRCLQGQAHPKPFEWFLWGGGLLLSLAATLALGRIALRLLRDTCNAKESES